MAEQFLEEIYEKSMILEHLQECKEYLATEKVTKTVSIWKECSDAIRELSLLLADYDIVLAKELVKNWEAAVNTKGDFKKLFSEISRGLIPCVQMVLEKYTGIDVCEGDWRITSADSGFLTLQRIKDEHYLYNSVDPMWEAFRLANSVYSPEAGRFYILGVGLGYLAYQIWELSGHSVELYVYEEDTQMLEYAKQYGVLDWIDREYLHIVTADEGEDVFLKKFFSSDVMEPHYISEWKSQVYQGGYAFVVKNQDFVIRTERNHRDIWKINRRKILEYNPLPVAELKKYQFEKEAIVVSAGPSLNDNIEFIKESARKRTIIAINAVLKRLYNENIKPDIIVMIDPLDNMLDHIKGVESLTEGVPLVTTLNSNFRFVEAYRGPVYIIPSGENEKAECEKGVPWENVGGTVASLGLETAFFIGAETIHLVGSDLAYTNGSNYASGVAHKEKENINDQSVIPAAGGGTVETNELYNMYRELMEAQIAQHPSVKVYNRAFGGARIAGTVEDFSES